MRNTTNGAMSKVIIRCREDVQYTYTTTQQYIFLVNPNNNNNIFIGVRGNKSGFYEIMDENTMVNYFSSEFCYDNSSGLVYGDTNDCVEGRESYAYAGVAYPYLYAMEPIDWNYNQSLSSK